MKWFELLPWLYSFSVDPKEKGGYMNHASSSP